MTVNDRPYGSTGDLYWIRLADLPAGRPPFPRSASGSAWPISDGSAWPMPTGSALPIPRGSHRPIGDSTIEACPTALARLTLVGEASNTLLAPDERRKAYLAQARLADRLYTAIKPHKRASKFAVRMATVNALSERIREVTTPGRADISAVLQRIGEVLDRSIEGVHLVHDVAPAIDLSRIDFKALAAKFKKSNTKNLDLARLKAAIRAQLDRMITVNAPASTSARSSSP